MYECFLSGCKCLCVCNVTEAVIMGHLDGKKLKIVVIKIDSTEETLQGKQN